MNLVLLLLLVTSVVTTFSAHIPVKGGRHRPDVTSPVEEKAITQNENKEDVNLELSKSSSMGEAALGINESTLKGQQSTISEERTIKDVTISADGELEREVKKESSQSTNTHEENHHSKTLTGEKHLFKKTTENQNQGKVVVREQTSSLGDASLTSPKQVKLEEEHKILITDDKSTHKILEDTLNDKKINQEETSHLIHNSQAHHSFPDNIHQQKQKTVITHDVIDHEKDSHQRHELNINTQGNNGIVTEKREDGQISTSAPFPKDGGSLKFDEIDQKKFEEKIGEVDQKKVGEKIFEEKLDEKVQGSLDVATGSKVHNIHHDQTILPEPVHKKDEHEHHPHHEYSWKGHHEHDFHLGKDQKHLEDDEHKKDESHHKHDSYHGHHWEGHHEHDFHPEHDQKHLKDDADHPHFEHEHRPYHGHHWEHHHEHDFHLGKDKKHLEDDEHKKDESQHKHDSYHGHHWEGHHEHDFHPEHDQKHLKNDAHHPHFEHEHHPYHGHHWEHHHEHDIHPKHHHEPPKDLPKPIPPVVEEKEVIKTDVTRVIEDQSGDKTETAFELETNTGSVKNEEEEKVISVKQEEEATEASVKKVEEEKVLIKEEGGSAGSITPDVPIKEIHHHHHHVKYIPVKGGPPHKHDYHDYDSSEEYPHEEKYHHHSQYDHHDYHEDVGSPYHSYWTEI